MLTIKPSKIEELQKLYKLERLCHSHPWTLNILKDCLTVGYLCHSFTIPCCKNPEKEQLIGFMINQVILDECNLLTICIHPSHQGKGYAANALNWLLELMTEKKIKSCLLEVRKSNDKAQALYRKIGFEQIGIRKAYYPADSSREDAIVMRKLL